jgi:hypothetical protein
LSDPYFEDVETFCSQRLCQVTLSLRVVKRPVGSVVSGVPVFCSLSLGCSMGALCLLKADLISTRRKCR